MCVSNGSESRDAVNSFEAKLYVPAVPERRGEAHMGTPCCCEDLSHRLECAVLEGSFQASCI